MMVNCEKTNSERGSHVDSGMERIFHGQAPVAPVLGRSRHFGDGADAHGRFVVVEVEGVEFHQIQPELS